MNTEEYDKKYKDLKNELRRERVARETAGSESIRHSDASGTSQGVDGHSTTNTTAHEPGVHDVHGQSKGVGVGNNRPASSNGLNATVQQRPTTDASGSGQRDKRSFQDQRNVRPNLDGVSTSPARETAERDGREQVSDFENFSRPPGAFFQDLTQTNPNSQATSGKGTLPETGGTTTQGIPGTTEKRKRGRPRKIIPVEEFKARQAEAEKVVEQIRSRVPKVGKPFKNVRVLSDQEAKLFLEPMQEVFLDAGHYIDQYIWARTNDVQKTPVWSDLSSLEAEILAKRWIKTGQRVPVVATATRAAVEGHDYIQIAEIVIPRTIETRRRLASAPKERSLIRRRKPDVDDIRRR